MMRQDPVRIADLWQKLGPGLSRRADVLRRLTGIVRSQSSALEFSNAERLFILD